jgi:hypothetical protein
MIAAQPENATPADLQHSRRETAWFALLEWLLRTAFLHARNKKRTNYLWTAGPFWLRAAHVGAAIG